MWSGIVASLDILKEHLPRRLSKVLFFSQTVSLILSHQGVMKQLLKDILHHKILDVQLQHMDLAIIWIQIFLRNISNISGGDGFSFIPDFSPILGSVFINGISNILTTATSYPKLHIRLTHGAVFEDGSDVQENRN